MRRLTRKDWALIAEAIQALGADYKGQHPHQERLDEIADYATARGDFSAAGAP